VRSVTRRAKTAGKLHAAVREVRNLPALPECLIRLSEGYVMMSLSLTGDDSDLFIASDNGWPVIDVGGIESARWLEAFKFACVV
jgi:hypothetical protein